MKGKMKILLVEDKVGGVLLKLLGKWGYEVLLAEDGEKAWEILSSEEIELFLVDWMLPGMSGLELVRKIRQVDRYQKTPILMISSRTSKEDIVQVAQVGIDGYIAKPFTPLQLKAKIEKTLEKRRRDPAFEARIQQIVHGHRAFDPLATAPLVLLGFGAVTEEELRAGEEEQIECLDRIREAISELNADDPGLKIGYLLAESTNEIAQLLSRWSIRERTCMIVISTACKGNSLLLVRLLAARGMKKLPFVLLYEEEDDIPVDLRAAAEAGDLYLLRHGGMEVEEWKGLIEQHL